MLVTCAAYENGRKLADLPVDDISVYLARPGCFVWVALAEPTQEELDAMAREFELHELAIEDTRKGHQRPKIEEYGESLFVVLLTMDPKPEEPGEYIQGEVHLFAGPNFVLSVRRRTPKGFADVRARCEREPENLKSGTGFVLYMLMDAIVDRYFPVIGDLEARLEELENKMFEHTPTRRNLKAFYDLRYWLTETKRAVAPLMESVGKLYGGRVPPIVAGSQNYFRDVYDHLARVNGSLDSLRDMLQTATQVSLTLITVDAGEITKKLAAWGALITVPTLIAGIYGMNFHKMPELDWKFGYPMALGVMGIVDTILYRKFRQAGWL